MWLGLAATTLLAVLHSVLGDCFFPFEYHGTYAVQTAPNQYSEVLIEINSILPYGFCHKKVDDNLILRDGSNGCLRCFHMAVRSANVLQLHTRDPQSSCATNLNDTYRLCPTAAELSSEEARRRGRVHEIIMYKTKTRTSEEHTAPVYCPISGRFSFTYESEAEGAVCPGTSSQLSSNCPYGFGLHLHFRGCSFQKNLNATYQCLADWDDGRGSRYLTLMDVNAAGTGRPRYRCALYREEVGTGRIFLSLSPDGSCHGRLQSATDGPERLVLYAAPSRPWPPAVRRATCTFPEWAHGHWQHAHISGNTIVYKDVANLASYTARCVGGGDDKFVIYTRSHCGEEQYNCIWLKERAVNVMELQLGLSPSPRISNSLCSPHRFEDSGWITQGRQRIVEEASCPVSGEYVGTIPATGGQLCARLSSDCRRPQNMLYTVTSCVDSTDVYEERQYRCLGTWREGDVLYTYTQRLDALTYECFAGRVLPDGRVFIGDASTETGCRRHVDPATSGMLIRRTAPCVGEDGTVDDPVPTDRRLRPSTDLERPSVSVTGAPTSAPRPPPTTRRSWRPITARPDRRSSAGHRQVSAPALAALAAALLLLAM
ncbi:uncharacterized protein LOC122382250 isoform X2 [Amphibalanus amphitrite]|uniref:uncharacterized protein LOC122382250 isoform X2 n=1 Tax=Amphibalanus amphitrite TaxID=1232801 RepID=UPI001C923894|nr:uncharacterized protein LOC122382250 isoform X2 [Amphibalanus amphitrite]